MLHLAGPMLNLTGSMLHLAEPMLHLAGPSSWANVTLSYWINMGQCYICMVGRLGQCYISSWANVTLGYWIYMGQCYISYNGKTGPMLHLVWWVSWANVTLGIPTIPNVSDGWSGCFSTTLVWANVTCNMLQDVMFLHVTSGRANVTSGMVGKLDQCYIGPARCQAMFMWHVARCNIFTCYIWQDQCYIQLGQCYIGLIDHTRCNIGPARCNM